MNQSQEESKEEFWKRVDEFCSGKGDVMDPGTVSITAIPKSSEKDKTKNSEENDNDNEDFFDGDIEGMIIE